MPDLLTGRSPVLVIVTACGERLDYAAETCQGAAVVYCVVRTGFPTGGHTIVRSYQDEVFRRLRMSLGTVSASQGGRIAVVEAASVIKLTAPR